MQGTIQSVRAERGVGFQRDANGADVLSHGSTLSASDDFVTLTVDVASTFSVGVNLWRTDPEQALRNITRSKPGSRNNKRRPHGGSTQSSAGRLPSRGWTRPYRI